MCKNCQQYKKGNIVDFCFNTWLTVTGLCHLTWNKMDKIYKTTVYNHQTNSVIILEIKQTGKAHAHQATSEINLLNMINIEDCRRKSQWTWRQSNKQYLIWRQRKKEQNKKRLSNKK